LLARSFGRNMDSCRQMRVAEPAISHDEVIEIIDALTDMKAWTREILPILEDEEQDEP
jgi:hypothetical protein